MPVAPHSVGTAADQGQGGGRAEELVASQGLGYFLGSGRHAASFPGTTPPPTPVDAHQGGGPGARGASRPSAG